MQQDVVTKTETTPLVDFEYLYELAGNDAEYLHEVLSLFLGTTPEGIEKLEHLIRETDDWEGIHRQAHFLKSSVSIVKVRNMYENLAQIEALAKKQTDKEQISNILDEIMNTWKAALPLIVAEKEKYK